jgi:hypothetical protein
MNNFNATSESKKSDINERKESMLSQPEAKAQAKEAEAGGRDPKIDEALKTFGGDKAEWEKEFAKLTEKYEEDKVSW